MSEEIKLWVIGPFTAVAAVQFGAAIRDLWRSWAARNQKPEPTDYERVVNNGATINGWKLAIPAMAGLNKATNEMIFYGPVDPLFINPESKRHLMTASECTVTLKFDHPHPGDWKIFSIRQYSLFDATEKILVRMMYKRWRMKPAFSAFVTPTTILTALRIYPKLQEVTNQKFQMIMVDTKKPRIQTFLAETPGETLKIVCAYVSNCPKPQLHVVYYADIDDDDGDGVEFFDYRYTYNDPCGAVSWTWDSIFIPVGNRSNHCWFTIGSAFIFVAIDDANLNDTDAHLCVTFDHTMTWRKETLTEWLVSFRNTTDGAMIIQASQAFSALSPPIEWGFFDVPALRYFNRLFSHGSNLFFATDYEGVLRRLMSPPSLKQTAIEAVLKSNPGLKMETMKTLLGAALFEAIFGEESKVVRVQPAPSEAE